MTIFFRVYYRAIFGALGGLLGWMLFGALGDRNTTDDAQQFQQLLGGWCVGACVGFSLAVIGALSDPSLVRWCRASAIGTVAGGIGGMLGVWAGDQVNYILIAGVDPASARHVWRSLRSITARGLGWLILSAFVGASEGLSSRSTAKTVYGVAGGALGGFAGGALLGTLVESVPAASHVYLWGHAIGLMFLGACIGALSGVIPRVARPARLSVTRGAQKGREFAVVKALTSIGRDEFADITLYHDSKVSQRHAVIRREAGRYVLNNQDAAPEQTRVNGADLREPRMLQDNDRIECGGIELRFHVES